MTGSSDKDVFVYEAGNDVITNYSGEDTVYIAAGGIDTYSFNGADLIFHIGDNSLTLKSMKNHAIIVKDSSGKTSTKIYGTGYSGADVMKNFVQSMANSSLNTKQKLDEAIKACSQFDSLQDVIDKLLSDRKKAGDAETFLRDYCGIFLDNADTGAVTGWDAGGLTVKTKDDLLPKSGTASYPSSTSFTKRGLTLTNIPEKSMLTEAEQDVVQTLYSADIEDSLKLIEETYGLKFTDKPLSIPLSLVHEPNTFGAAWAGIVGLTINLSKGYAGVSTISHELTHVMQQHFNCWSDEPNFLFEGMADVTAGHDDSRDFKVLAENPAKLAQYLKVNSNIGSDFNVYTAGIIFWRYLMRQASDSYDSTAPNAWDDNVNIEGTTTGELLTGSGNSLTISASDGNDTVTAYGKNMQLIGGAGNDQIFIGDNASGKILYASGDGNDTIDGFNSNYTLEISGGSYTTQTSGNDVIVKVVDGSITLKDAKGLTLNIKGTQGGSSTSTTTGGGSSSTTKGGGSSTSTTTGGSSSSTTKGGGSSTSTTTGGSSSSTIKSGTSTSTQSTSSTSTKTKTKAEILASIMGGTSTSTTRYGGSTSTGTSSTSTTTGGGSSTSTTTGGGSSSTTKGGGSSTSTTTGGGSSSTTNQFVYTGGDKTISNYAGQPITLGTDYTGSTFDDSGNFYVSSSTGALVIQNAADKIVDLRDGAGKAFIKAFNASTAGVIDGRGLAGYEIINGATAGSNVIFASDGGSQLWGGSGSDADALVGGNGADIFNGGRFQGADNIFNASSADVVNLTDATLSDIVATVGNNNGVAIGFNTGNVVNIQSTEALSAAINLADGSSWRYNHVTKGWQTA